MCALHRGGLVVPCSCLGAILPTAVLVPGLGSIACRGVGPNMATL